MKKGLYYIGWIVVILSVVLGLYVGGYLMFIKPIAACLVAFDTGVLTGSMIGWTIVKCIFAGTAGGLIFAIGYYIAMVLIYFSNKW